MDQATFFLRFLICVSLFCGIITSLGGCLPVGAADFDFRLREATIEPNCDASLLPAGFHAHADHSQGRENTALDSKGCQISKYSVGKYVATLKRTAEYR